MSKKLDLKSIKIKSLINKYSKKYGKHAIFAAILLVCLVYLIVILRISSLAKAEPTPEQLSGTEVSLPKVDKKAVDQIQTLEKSNTEIHSLFERARNNPFEE